MNSKSRKSANANLNKVFSSIVKHFVSLSHFDDSFDPTEFNLGKDLNTTTKKLFWSLSRTSIFYKFQKITYDIFS